MEAYRSGKSTYAHWKIPNLRGVIEPEHVDYPPEYTVFTHEHLYRPVDANTHTCRIQGAEKYTKDGYCTPPLVFLQVAATYSIHELIYLGLQICSYREGEGPISTVKELQECAKALRGMRGRRKARRALKYIKEGSRSAAESQLFMRLSLPNALGGLGFRDMEFNKQVHSKKHKRNFYFDLYVPSKKLGIEYDSYQYHNNAKSYSADTVRAAKLESEGYRVLTVKPVQLYSLQELEVLGENLAKRVGKRIRIRARKFFEGFRAITDVLQAKGRGLRKRLEKVKREEVPNFYGVEIMYSIYEESWRRLCRYPESRLVLEASYREQVMRI